MACLAAGSRHHPQTELPLRSLFDEEGKMLLKSLCTVSRIISSCSIFLILFACGSGQATDIVRHDPGQVADITIDGTQKFQIMDGLGVNANSERWNNGELKPALDTLIDTMGATVWRVVVESLQNWETTNDDPDPFIFNWTYYNALYETTKFKNLWGILGYLKQKNVSHITLSVMGCLPSWMGGCSLNTGSSEDEWVEMITSLLYYARNTKKLRIDSVSGFNEPDWGNNEGPVVGATQYVRVLKKLSARMDALGLGDIKIAGPDCAQVAVGRDTYMPAILADTQLMGKVQHFGYHSYSGDSSGIDDSIKASAYPDRNYWMTEFSAWCSGCDTGSQPPDDWTFGSDTFDYLVNHINQGATSALIWEGYDSYYEHHSSWSYWGLLSYNQSTGKYTARKRMYINAHVFKYVEPGAVRISASTAQSGLTLLAFTNPVTNRFTIVGNNKNPAGLTINATLIGPSPATSLQFYQTTTTANFIRREDVLANGNTFSVPVAANSFFTLTSAPGPNVAPLARPAILRIISSAFAEKN
jgi:O-glycosyl hydrolase